MNTFNYNKCIKPPSKGGWSRSQVDQYAQKQGIDPKKYRTKQALCEHLRDLMPISVPSAPPTPISVPLAPPVIATRPSAITVTVTPEIISTRPETMTNAQIAELLTKLSKQLARDKDMHRSRAIKTGADIISAFLTEITNVEQLKGIKGIKTGIRGRVDEILKTGTLSELKEDIYDFTQIMGFGPSHHQSLHKLGISSLEQLKEAIAQGKYVPTHLQDIGIRYKEDFEQRIPRSEITEITKLILGEIQKLDPETRGTVVGSYRRGTVSSGDIDILIASPKDENILQQLIKRLRDIKLIEDILSLGEVKFMGTYRSEYPELESEMDIRRKIDIRYVPYSSYPSALLHSTGSAKLNVVMRNKAIEKGLSLSEHGLRDLKTNKYLQISSEQDIFEKLDIKYLEPRERNL